MIGTLRKIALTIGSAMPVMATWPSSSRTALHHDVEGQAFEQCALDDHPLPASWRRSRSRNMKPVAARIEPAFAGAG
jgi:hypothetical protein